MKTISKLGIVALLFATAIYSCKNASLENSAEAAMDSTSVSSKLISSSAAVEPKKSDRKFVRTADIKFKVKNVPQATYSIENEVNKYGGFVIYTNLQSDISDKETTRISQDSTLETTKYSVVNDITIRVPNTKLDTVIKSISKQIDFLNSREIKADDVTLKMLSNELAQNRNSNHSTRLAKAIDTKGKKLNQIVDAENDLEVKAEEKDNSKIENLSLNDQVNFSTLTLNIYQRETIKQELIANPKVYRQNIGSKIIDGLKTGWYMLEGIIAFFVQLWSLFLIGFVTFFLYKKYLKK